MVEKKKTKATFIILLTVIIFCVFVVLQIIHYSRVQILCKKIENGEEINTNISNAKTVPLWLNRILIMGETTGTTPLLTACKSRNVQAVEVLLKNGADPNYGCEMVGQTPLSLATYHRPDERSVQIVNLLIEYGADINYVCRKHRDDVAVDSFAEEMAEYLNDEDNPYNLCRQEIFVMLLNEEIDHIGRFGDPIIHKIVLSKNTYIMKRMVDKYAFDINAIDTANGRTALIRAVCAMERCFSAEMISTIVDLGADLTVKDNEGKTAYDYAVEKGYSDIAELVKP